MTSKKKLIVFDLDGTLTEGYFWNRLNAAMGVTKEEYWHYHNAYHEQKISYCEWVDALIKIYRRQGNLTRERIEEILLNYTFLPGAQETIQALKAKGWQIALLSGAMDTAVTMVAGHLEIKLAGWNTTFFFDEHGQLENVKALDEEAKVKLNQLLVICQELNVNVTDCVCVGDGYNDIPLFKATGRGITFEHCEVLHDHSWKIVKTLPELVALVD